MAVHLGTRSGFAVVAATACVLSVSGCVSTVAGLALRDPDAAPLETVLTENDLEGLLLTTAELNQIVGSSGLAISFDSPALNDNSAAVSDQSCLAAAFGAQESVYADTGWTAVRDQIVREPGEHNPHWIEQVVVLVPSGEQAQAFLEQSHRAWEGCAGTLVTYDSNDMPLTWSVSEVTDDDSVISQMSAPEGAPSGGCHHALAASSNVIVETWACGDDIVDQAQTIGRAIVANIEKK